MTPIIHRKCGTQIGWYMYDAPHGDGSLRSAEFQRMDGTHPEYGAYFREWCPHCESHIRGAGEIKRVFANPPKKQMFTKKD